MKRLGVIDAAGVEFEVFEATAAEVPQLEDALGLCAPTQAKIFIRTGLAPTWFRNVLFHESLHAIWAVVELGNCIDDEERFIRVITPHLIALLVSIKKLRFR